MYKAGLCTQFYWLQQTKRERKREREREGESVRGRNGPFPLFAYICCQLFMEMSDKATDKNQGGRKRGYDRAIVYPGEIEVIFVHMHCPVAREMH